MVLYTVIRFWVRVPVLSVQMTVVAPIVSQACILRTRLFDFSILRMLRARLKVTLIGSPSGTVTTIKVTEAMNADRIFFPRLSEIHACASHGFTPKAKPTASMTTNAPSPYRNQRAQLPCSMLRGSSFAFPRRACTSYITGTHTLASMMTAAIINAPISPSCPHPGVGDAGLKKMALMNRMVNVAAAPQNPTTPMNFASESSCLSSGVGSSLFSEDFSATFPNSVASPTASTCMIP